MHDTLAGHEGQRVACASPGPGVDEHRPAGSCARGSRHLGSSVYPRRTRPHISASRITEALEDARGTRGGSSTVEPRPSKAMMRVRLPSAAFQASSASVRIPGAAAPPAAESRERLTPARPRALLRRHSPCPRRPRGRPGQPVVRAPSSVTVNPLSARPSGEHSIATSHACSRGWPKRCSGTERAIPARTASGYLAIASVS